jgi:calcium/calmodulin-dependent protein kinase I
VSDDPEVQEMLASGWVVAPKKPNVAVQNNVPSIFSNRVDVSYLWQGKEEEQPPDQPEEQLVDVDLSREKVGTVYTIGPELGRGLGSIVKSGKAKAGNGDVAIKVVSSATAGFITAEQRKQHADILQEVSQHPHIVKLLQKFDANDAVHLVLEKMHGEVFRQVIKQAADYSEKDACSVVKQVLEAVQFLHSKQVLHGDITPENVLAVGDKPDNVKLCGFTLARRMPSNGEMMCAEEFKAPESLMRQPVTLQSDMWSLGCLAYFALSGYPPFADKNTIKLQASIRKGQFQFPDADWAAVSPEAKDFIKKVLVLDPKQRLTAAQALEHAWIKSGGKPNKLANFKKHASSHLN